MSTADSKNVMIIAGEASGDLHGAKLVSALRRRCADIFFSGIGGSAMKSAGVRILVDAHQLSVVGITEIFSRGIPLLKGISTAKKHLRDLRPDLLILIDFPDFNLHVAATAKKAGGPGSLLHQPPDLGLACRACQKNSSPRGPHGGNSPFRRRLL